MLGPALLHDGLWPVGCGLLPVVDILMPRWRPSARGTEDNYNMTDAVVPAASDRWIYHFTHVDNLAGIRTAACLRCDAEAR